MTEPASSPSAESYEPDADEVAGPLPDAVRTRIIALVADLLGQVPAEELPASLKRVAAFAPARRAKLAGNQIASVLETDSTFREHVATQLRGRVGELARALEDGRPPAAADPAELAAVAYVLRPEGWTSVIEQATQVAETEHAAAESRQLAEQLARLHRQLDDARAELRQRRQEHKYQVAALKSENSELRHKLAEARSRAKAAEASEAALVSASSQAVADASTVARAAESESRRLSSRVQELERDLAAVRRADRTQKGSEAIRARLLLDTLLETAEGLRRELALPPVEGSPADAVEADLAQQGSRGSTGHLSLRIDDPALLDQLLTLPRTHMIVDGYNVTKTAWPSSSLEVQRDRLMTGLASLVARIRAEVTVVFDAAAKAERPVVKTPRGVRVLFSPPGVIADDVIRQLVGAEPQGRPVVVVTSDQEIIADVTRSGARAIASAALSRLLGRS